LSWTRTSVLAAIALAGVLLHPPPVLAVDNAATGGIGGHNNGTLLNGDGTGEARITLLVEDLALIKQARDLAGIVLPDGTDVSPGQEIYFVLFVDNPTNAPAGNLQISDPLIEADFTYVTGSLEQTLVPSGSGDAAIWAGAWTPLTDALGAPDDTGSVVDTGGPPGADRITVGATPGQVNQTADVPAGFLRAVRFRVRVN
jgi:uncharacterized repeat protein (TIGR01451 family)